VEKNLEVTQFKKLKTIMQKFDKKRQNTISGSRHRPHVLKSTSSLAKAHLVLCKKKEAVSGFHFN